MKNRPTERISTGDLKEDITFGIDLGIGSCGWAVIRHPSHPDESGRIEGLGSWCFDVPETKKERTPTNQIRCTNRLLRRVVRRRRNRIAEIRRLFLSAGLLTTSGRDAFKHAGIDPWEMRAKGLDKPLGPVEFAVALGHIAKRRGFKSSAKRKTMNAVDDDRRMLAALNKTKEHLARYRTVGEMYARDPEYTSRRRNRDGVYDRSASRDDLAYEVEKLFAQQRKFGCEFASTDLEEAFMSIAFRQLPLQDGEAMVGYCSIEHDERRASALSPSFEKFRLLTRLINIRIVTHTGVRPLTTDELKSASENLGENAGLTFIRLRRILRIAENELFSCVGKENEDRDVAVRTGSATPGTYAIRKAVGEAKWASLVGDPNVLDRIAHALTFFEANETIMGKLQDIGIAPAVLEDLGVGLENGAFSRFKGTAGLSTMACRKLIPHLMEGHRYDQACRLAGYDHSATRLTGGEQVDTRERLMSILKEVQGSITNPIARKALTEGLKQIWTMRNKWGLPGAIHIELAREVGHGIDKRREIERGLDAATDRRERENDEARGLLDPHHVEGETLLRYRLWKEQGGVCLYTGKKIHPIQIVATDNGVQVDHVLPWSRFGDDSFNNKVLCLSDANQRKRQQTPFEWFSSERSRSEWEEFVKRVESNPSLKGLKKRNLLLKNAEERESGFRNRNLNDTRYAARILAEAVKLLYPQNERQEKGGIRRVFTRPGTLTSVLRRAWGVETLKKKMDGKRIHDDRSHALDAAVVAVTSERELQKLTKAFQAAESKGLGRDFSGAAQPWPGFRDDLADAYGKVLVARPERRRARGEGHEATVRRIEHDGKDFKTSERLSVLTIGMDKGKFNEKKGLAQLDRLKDIDRNRKTYDAIRDWLTSGRPLDRMPVSPRGDVIRKVRLLSTTKPGIPVRDGTARRGGIVRVDVFSKANRKGRDEWYLVPVYPHQVTNKKTWKNPPMYAAVANKEEIAWAIMDESHTFRFSLYPRSYVEIVKPDGEVIEGYFSGVDRSKASINIASDKDLKPIKGIGVKLLSVFKKYAVDRLGSKAAVKNEVRTWRGKVCTGGRVC